ncbi:hypothetical protein KIPB_011999, partial [Kipferlia bialata]
ALAAVFNLIEESDHAVSVNMPISPYGGVDPAILFSAAEVCLPTFRACFEEQGWLEPDPVFEDCSGVEISKREMEEYVGMLEKTPVQELKGIAKCLRVLLLLTASSAKDMTALKKWMTRAALLGNADEVWRSLEAELTREGKGRSSKHVYEDRLLVLKLALYYTYPRIDIEVTK